jgi:molybdopterin-binding protein
MKLSVRNILKGKVAAVTEGAVAANVKVDIGGGNHITAVVTLDAVKDLGITVGDPISVLIKSTSIMLAKE